jgi:hypothetical protein
LHRLPLRGIDRSHAADRALESRRRSRLTGLFGVGAAIACAVVCLAPSADATQADLPNPCALVAPAVIASAFGTKTAPSSSDVATSNTSTCSYKNGQLTIELGYTALTSPQAPIRTSVVKGLPHGQLYVYAGSRSQLVFYRGTAANGIYAVIRNFVKIPASKLEKIAKALNAQMTGLTGSGGAHIIG